jgi:Excalibur calcium-binding domain
VRPTVLLAVALALGAAAAPAEALVPPQWKNCKAVNARYPHGVGKVGAHDKTSGVPVTNFKRSSKLYRVALAANGGLDRDHDGIACETK